MYCPLVILLSWSVLVADKNKHDIGTYFNTVGDWVIGSHLLYMH